MQQFALPPPYLGLWYYNSIGRVSVLQKTDVKSSNLFSSS